MKNNNMIKTQCNTKSGLRDFIWSSFWTVVLCVLWRSSFAFIKKKKKQLNSFPKNILIPQVKYCLLYLNFIFTELCCVFSLLPFSSSPLSCWWGISGVWGEPRESLCPPHLHVCTVPSIVIPQWLCTCCPGAWVRTSWSPHVRRTCSQDHEAMLICSQDTSVVPLAPVKGAGFLPTLGNTWWCQI